MIGREAEEVLNRAVRLALERRHEYFTLEHVLLSLLDETTILEIIQACGGSYSHLKEQLEKYIEKEIPRLKDEVDDRRKKSPFKRSLDTTRGEAGGRNATVPSTKDTSKDYDDDELDSDLPQHPVATLSIQRMIQRALFHVQSAGKDEITPEDLFVAIFQSKDSFSLGVLEAEGLRRLDVLNYISHGNVPASANQEGVGESRDSDSSEKGADGGATRGAPASRSTQAQKAAKTNLEGYTVNLNQLAKEGRIDPLVGRENELQRVIQVLCRRQKNNPLLVGEAGVGKTALAEGLALKIINKEVPSILEKAEVYALDLGSLLAGAKFRGDFESRLKKVLTALQKRKDEGFVPILLIDEIHTLIGAGAVTGSVLDAANLLKPVLSRGEIQCIGSTTYKEFRGTFEKDSALARRFQKIDVPEPSQDEAVKILEGLKNAYEKHHSVEYTAEALKAAVALSAKHLTDRFLPDKAIDVIDEAGALSRLKRLKDESIELTSKIEASEIEEMVSKIARIPARSVSTSQKTRLKNLERDLQLTIFGQSQAVNALVTTIRLARSGLRTGERPVGSFLFCGPTGVGKTELSKQLALSMGVQLLRFDMSEYMEKHTVSRLIGAPPGYVGFEQAGLLTDAVLKNPHSVILLDEIEKAHFDIWNILLQVMDHGILTDNNGRRVDFRNTILIMTSNVGTRELDRGRIGGGMYTGKDSLRDSVSKQEIEKTFSPEFRNRLDSIVYFNVLDPVTIAQVVGKQLMELENQLLAKHVELDLDSDVREWLAHKGYDRKMGARPLARLIQEKLKKPLSEQILFGALENGGKVRVVLRETPVILTANQKREDLGEISLIVEPRADALSVLESPEVGSKSDHGK